MERCNISGSSPAAAVRRNSSIAIRPRTGPTNPQAGFTPALPVDQNAGQPGGQRTALRHVGRGDLRRRDDLHHLRVGELHARQPQSAGGNLAHDRHVAELHLRRQGRGHDQHADLPDRRRVYRRPDGRPHARVPRQEGRGPRNEARHARLAGPSDLDPHAHRLFRGHGLGTEGHEQSRGPRVLRGALRVQFGLGEQRLGIRRPEQPPGAPTIPRVPIRLCRRIRLGTSPRAW